ncbi:GNAT family N-acetyltransferase [Sutcliffiella halmapala]|uniref:GNAT family N-acetyltransferase n=1 Tax=Sutcliffiella halmapala TaxID=79882 RepID=UPI000994FDA7|nr:GNAT family N-acetyltransferase [Sutcliffiella halmapala]
MFIRELRKQELTIYLELLKELDREMVFSINEAEQLFEQIKVYPFYKIFVLEVDKQIAATFTLIICDNFGHGGLKFAIVENVVVHPSFKRMGIGKQMMDMAAEIATENNCYKLMLSSNEKREDAHAFYDALDFKRHGVSFMMELIKK